MGEILEKNLKKNQNKNQKKNQKKTKRKTKRKIKRKSKELRRIHAIRGTRKTSNRRIPANKMPIY
jgi:hypothetical protein